MKRWFRIFWARVRCNFYVLWHILRPSGKGVCEVTMYDGRHRITVVAAVYPDFMTIVEDASGGWKVNIKLASIDKVFYSEDPQA